MVRCLVPTRVGNSTFDIAIYKSTFPYLYLDLASKGMKKRIVKNMVWYGKT